MIEDILIKIKEIQACKKNFSCNCCATCCKLAGSAFSYEELAEKAGKKLTDMTLPEMDILWNRAKEEERRS